MTSAPIKRVLAIDPYSRGIAYAVLEGPQSLIDWGLKSAPTADRNAHCLRLALGLLDEFRPNVLVIESCRGERKGRCDRVRRLLGEMAILAAAKKIPVRRFSRSQIRRTFSPTGRITKYQIACAIAERFPELAARRPQFRKPWMPEEDRMNIFDAVALALTFFEAARKRTSRGTPTITIS